MLQAHPQGHSEHALKEFHHCRSAQQLTQLISHVLGVKSDFAKIGKANAPLVLPTLNLSSAQAEFPCR